MDFLHDQLTLGTKLRIPTIVDTYSRFCPAAGSRFTCCGEDVVQTLERVCAKVGCPRTNRVDNGSEFISRDLDLWAYANDVTLDFSRLGKPTDNGLIDAFNSKLRSECLNARRHYRSDQWRNNGDFMSLADAPESWRIGEALQRRPTYSAIGYKVPTALHYHGGAASPSPGTSRKTPASSSSRCGSSVVAPSTVVMNEGRPGAGHFTEQLLKGRWIYFAKMAPKPTQGCWWTTDQGTAIAAKKIIRVSLQRRVSRSSQSRGR
jgi:putative transposase